jgi:hypothetical protein
VTSKGAAEDRKGFLFSILGGRGSFDPMVGQSDKSLILFAWQRARIVRAFQIFSHRLPFATVWHTSRAVYFGHKFDPTRSRFEPSIVRKLLRNKRKLVAGAGSNRRPWGYEDYFSRCIQRFQTNNQHFSRKSSRLSRT